MMPLEEVSIVSEETVIKQVREQIEEVAPALLHVDKDRRELIIFPEFKNIRLQVTDSGLTGSVMIGTDRYDLVTDPQQLRMNSGNLPLKLSSFIFLHAPSGQAISLESLIDSSYQQLTKLGIQFWDEHVIKAAWQQNIIPFRVRSTYLTVDNISTFEHKEEVDYFLPDGTVVVCQEDEKFIPDSAFKLRNLVRLVPPDQLWSVHNILNRKFKISFYSDPNPKSSTPVYKHNSVARLIILNLALLLNPDHVGLLRKIKGGQFLSEFSFFDYLFIARHWEELNYLATVNRFLARAILPFNIYPLFWAAESSLAQLHATRPMQLVNYLKSVIKERAGNAAWKYLNNLGLKHPVIATHLLVSLGRTNVRPKEFAKQALLAKALKKLALRDKNCNFLSSFTASYSFWQIMVDHLPMETYENLSSVEKERVLEFWALLACNPISELKAHSKWFYKIRFWANEFPNLRDWFFNTYQYRRGNEFFQRAWERPRTGPRSFGVWVSEQVNEWHRQMIQNTPFKGENVSWEPRLPSKEIVFQGLIFRELTSAAELHQEGQLMSHCVGSYTALCQSNHSAIFHVSRTTASGKIIDVGTLEILIEKNKIGQFAGMQNGPVSRSYQEIAQKFLKKYRYYF